jgi:hypothetical protein
VTKHDLAGAHRLGGNSGIGLQTDSEVRGGSAGAGPAHNFFSGPQRHGRSSRARQMLGAFRNGADGGLEIQFRRINLGVFRQMHRLETRDRMCGVGHAKLAAQSQRWHAGVVRYVHDVRIWDGVQQIAYEIIQFNVSDEMRGLMVTH